MFAEIVEWLTTSCPPEARALGYLREAIAIRARYRRHRADWQPHLDRTKDVIEQAVAATPQHRRVVVLGAGALLDIPIQSLAAQFKQVELVDLVHPRKARQIAAAHANIIHRSEDITGVAKALMAMDRGTSTLPDVTALPKLATDTDLVISANLLSQLHDIPCAWLARRTSVSETDRLAFGQSIVRGHLDWLNGLKSVVCVITDTQRRYIDGEGNAYRAWDSLQGESLPGGAQTWFWNIAPAGETHPDYSLQMTVHGVPDLAQARRQDDAT